MGDYYETLGVERTASADEIKSKYRKLAMKYHPDRNQGDKDAEEKFKKITEAYETLGDEQKRREYDNFGSARQNSQNYWQKTQSRENPFQSNGNGFYGFSKETEDDPFAQWAGNGTRFYYYTTQSRQTSPQNREDVVPDVIRNVIFAVFGFVLLGLPLLRILGVLLFFKGVFGALRSLRRLV